MEIEYAIGDATQPKSAPAIIVHVCNDRGGWGRGFVVALSRRWPEPERRYRAWHRGEEPIPFELGQVILVPVEPGVWVANLIGQHGMRTERGTPPVRYDAIRQGLRVVAQEALRLGASVQMPRIGCGLAGGTWDVVGPIVQEELGDRGVAVTVCDLPPRPES